MNELELREKVARLIDAGFDVGCDCNACKDMLGIADQILALIGKCATPTFPGEKENHCKDCCCAESWKALGIEKCTGLSIPEHIKELKAELFELKGGFAPTEQNDGLFAKITEKITTNDIYSFVCKIKKNNEGGFTFTETILTQGEIKPIPAEKKEFSISKCCNASVHTNMSPDFIGDNPKTQKIGTCYYICDACGEPCDLAEWNKEPKSKDRIGE
jgi:hypothetical protein